MHPLPHTSSWHIAYLVKHMDCPSDIIPAVIMCSRYVPFPAVRLHPPANSETGDVLHASSSGQSDPLSMLI
jgi:hypothetical protein